MTIKHFCLILVVTFYCGNFFGQQVYTNRKGSKFFPGHFETIVTIDAKSVRYELFNHWYSWAYAELRQITIPLDSLASFNNGMKDSLKILIVGDMVKIIDNKYGLNRRIKKERLCAPVGTMRKISYAYSLSSKEIDMRHFELYEDEDLKLSEKDFIEKVNENLKRKKK